jgi:hypothetical protein
MRDGQAGKSLDRCNLQLALWLMRVFKAKSPGGQRGYLFLISSPAAT